MNQHGQIKKENVGLHHESLKDALLCHFPYAILSVALSILCLSILMFGQAQGSQGAHHAHRLFHSLHLIHILFAGTGVVLTFRRYSSSLLQTVLVGFAVPAFFCTLSDAIMPYFGGLLLNLPMKLHWCFIAHTGTVCIFLLAGILNGMVLSLHSSDRIVSYSIGSHFLHIFISSLASTFYFVSFGLEKWWHHIGFLFSFLVFAVVVPCTLADLVVPMLYGMRKSRDKSVKIDGCCGDEKHARNSN
jgi:hypothetical protein